MRYLLLLLVLEIHIFIPVSSIYKSKIYSPQFFKTVENFPFEDGVYRNYAAEVTGSTNCEGIRNIRASSCPQSHKIENAQDFTSNVAQTAAQEAKAASDAQNEAAVKAAQEVKQKLADQATQAAKAAEAALAGKLQLKEQLEHEVQQAVESSEKMSMSLQKTQSNLAEVLETAKNAQTQVEKLSHAVNNTKTDIENWDKALSDAQAVLADRTAKVNALEKRYQKLQEELTAAKDDLERTKEAALKAIKSAQQAKDNACRSCSELQDDTGAGKSTKKGNKRRV